MITLTVITLSGDHCNINHRFERNNLIEINSTKNLFLFQMSSTSLPAPILGLCIVFPPSSLVFLISDYRLQTLPLSAPYFIQPLLLLSLVSWRVFALNVLLLGRRFLKLTVFYIWGHIHKTHLSIYLSKFLRINLGKCWANS